MNVSILKAPDEKHDPITIKINTVLGRPDLCKSGWWGNEGQDKNHSSVEVSKTNKLQSRENKQ